MSPLRLFPVEQIGGLVTVQTDDISGIVDFSIPQIMTSKTILKRREKRNQFMEQTEQGNQHFPQNVDVHVLIL